VEGLKGAVGEIGDNRLTVMAGIAVVDDLAEAERRIAALEAQVAELTEAGQEIAAELESTEARFARKLDQAAKALENASNTLDQSVALS
jgi:cell division protein ZapA